MSRTTLSTRLAVSLQNPDATEPACRHLATGILADARTVVVPEASHPLMKKLRGDFHVLIVPAGRSADEAGPTGPVEWIRPAEVREYRPKLPGNVGAVAVTLARPSRNAPQLGDGCRCALRTCRLDEVIERHGDSVRIALADQGLLPDGYAATPPPDGALPHVPRSPRSAAAHGGPVLRFNVFDPCDLLPKSWCRRNRH